MENFIREYWLEESICDGLLEYHKNNSEYNYKTETKKDSTNEKVKVCNETSFYSNSQNPTIKNYFNNLNSFIKKYMDEFDFLNSKASLYTDDATLIQEYQPYEGYYPWHSERSELRNTRRQLVFMTYLNDVPDGGTQFKYQNLTVKAKKGKTLIWPSDFTHTHKGQISTTTTKTIVTGWLSYY